jgi:sugar-specific transcriptional regulator TrmB
MAQWNKLLKSLGFSDSESTIYLTSLELGPAPVQDIAKKAGVSRVTTYAVIEDLTARGLMSSVQKGKRRLFAAESPERLVSFVHSRVNEMQATLKEVEASLEELKLAQRGEKPVVKFFEGEEGVRAVIEEMIKNAAGRVYEIGNLDEFRRIVAEPKRKEFRRRLDKQKVRTQAIYLTKLEKPVHRTTTRARYLDHRVFDFGGDMVIFGNKIALASLRGKPIGVLIESDQLADTMRQVFNIAWSSKLLKN